MSLARALAVLFLLAQPVAALANPDAAALPSADSSAFRTTMLGWQAPPQPVARSVGEPGRWPLASGVGRVSSRFGVRADPFDGGMRFHKGVDIAGPIGTPVSAFADGIVRVAETANGYGKLVIVDHGNGLETRYAHLSAVLVHPGEIVHGRDPIGLMGSTGRSTGSHLHFEMRQNGRLLDPDDAATGTVTVSSALAPAAAEVKPRWTGWSTARDQLPSAF